MKELPRRLALWLLMLAVSFLLFLQGHPISHMGKKAPFLPGRGSVPGGTTIRLVGDLGKTGVYFFESTVSLGTVINVTVPFLRETSLKQELYKKKLYSGDLVILRDCDIEHAEIKRNSIRTEEKMIVGIPLDPNSLTMADWVKLPRIGPSLARKIVLDRQENGDFRSINDLARVPGIGTATVRQLKEYFGYDVAY